MTVTIKKTVSKGTTSVQESKAGKPVGVPLESEEIIPTKATSAEQAQVGMTMGYTKNLGNYESAKVTVSLTMPCAPTLEEVQSRFNEVEDWVNTKMQEIAEQLK